MSGQYGMFYRKKFGGKGYVFQSRSKSTIIENDAYLIKSIEKSELSVRIKNMERFWAVRAFELFFPSSALSENKKKKIGAPETVEK
jgi:hypothetical protein